MLNLVMTTYILIWPAVVAATLAVMCWGVYRDAQAARREGESLV